MIKLSETSHVLASSSVRHSWRGSRPQKPGADRRDLPLDNYARRSLRFARALLQRHRFKAMRLVEMAYTHATRQHANSKRQPAFNRAESVHGCERHPYQMHASRLYRATVLLLWLVRLSREQRVSPIIAFFIIIIARTLWRTHA